MTLKNQDKIFLKLTSILLGFFLIGITPGIYSWFYLFLFGISGIIILIIGITIKVDDWNYDFKN